MAYVNVAEWKPDQVTEWIRGLDACIEPYVQGFLNNSIGGAQILGFGPDDLENLGITKIGHQEIILDGIDHLRIIHYELDRENLQLLALRMSCLAHSLHNELCQSHGEADRLATQILADISTMVGSVKRFISWLDRPGFSGEVEYERVRRETLRLALRLATCGQRDRFVEAPVSEIKTASAHLAKLADSIVQEMTDPLILQPASLDLATIKKRSSDDLGFYIVPSFQGVHKISDIKLNSAAHQSGKIEPGDEIIQINYQTVVGWNVKEVMSLFAESPNEILLTLKKRPRHTKVYGQIYVKPYRLPSKKRAIQQAHTADILTRIHFRIPIHSLKIPIPSEKKKEAVRKGGGDSRGREESSSDEEVVTVQHKLVVPSKPVHRRATITGASPLSKRPPFDISELWHEMKLEKESAIKQSTTSVIDFEERLASVGREPEASSESALETLSIKQKIQMFSRESDKNDRNKSHPNPPHPPKPQIRINSEPIFDGKSVCEVGKKHDKLAAFLKNLPQPPEELPQPLKPLEPPPVQAERKSLPEPPVPLEVKSNSEKLQKYSECEKNNNIQKSELVSFETSYQKNDVLFHEQFQKSEAFCHDKNIFVQEKQNKLELLCSEKSLKPDLFFPLPPKEKNVEPQAAAAAASNEEHGKVVETINKHLLMNKLSDDSDIFEYPCYKPKSPTCTSNSLPHHGKLKTDVEKKATHSLPSRGRVESDSELSKTISKVITEEKERMSFPGGKPVKAKEHKPLAKAGQSMYYSKSYSSESLDKGFEGRGRRDEADMAQKYNSLEDRHLRREATAAEARSPGQGSSPPVPPPRPSLSKPTNPCYRAAIIAAHHLIGKASPKAHRKKHPLLSKGRNVSLKDFPIVEVEGWLVQRCRKGTGSWNRRWCLIHSNTLYTFTSKQASKAETMVCLPGFTAALAEEVKSRPFAFKVYHTGTMFYFAAETNFELSVWLDAITTATLGPNPNNQAVVYSESDGETSSPASKAPTPAPRPSPGEASGGTMFGSLKKLGGAGSSSASPGPSPGAGGGSSLDRKCLRILGGPGPVPVPTAHYRSYRRVHNPPPPPPPISSPREPAGEKEHPPAEMADYRLTSHSTPPIPRRRTVRETEAWNTPSHSRPVPPPFDDRMRRVPDHLPMPGAVQLPQPSWDGVEHSFDPFPRPPANRKKIKMKKPHLGGGVRGVYPAPPPVNRQPPPRPPPQDNLMYPQHAPPDYPGLEYPPVFEPGTYTLDTSSLLLSRQHHHHQPPS